MFGTLKPPACGLGCHPRHEYASFYCGLCKSLGDHFGQVSRAMLNYDAVFLALVADGLVGEGAAPDRCRCPLLPIAFRPTVRPDSPAMRYAAAMQMLLADQWLADRAMDGGGSGWRAARPLLTGKVEAARAILGELGISLAELEGFEERQCRAEVPGQTGPRDAAEPTAAALELVFERMALLPGVPEEGRTPAARATLGAFGRRLGSAIYLIDALDDLEKDHRGGAFNPCLLPGQVISWPRVEMAWGMLHDDLAALGTLAGALPLRRHRDLVRSVVAAELPRLAHAAAKRAHAHARADNARDARRRASLRAEAWPRRALAAAATIFVLLWVWLSSIPALARGPKRPSLPSAHDGGAAPERSPSSSAPAHSAPPEQWEPQLPPASSATPDGGSAPATGMAPAAPGATPDAGAPGPAPGGRGGGCPNPCSGWGDTLGSMCSTCSKCWGGCTSGDCGGCTKVCESCGSCGSCCNGCNNCNCNGCCR